MSDSSLDSELLAGVVKGGKKRGRKALSDSDYEESDESVSAEEESEEWEEEKPSKKKGSAQKPARKKRATRGRKAASSDEDDDDEEDEDSGDSGGGGAAPASGGRGAGGGGGGGGVRRRGPKDEDSDDDGFEIDDEALIEGEEDRKRLAAMTELQREFELANRAEARNQELLRQKLLKQDAKAAEAGAKAAKRVGRAKSGREEREEAAKKSAMEELKAARERKARGAEERARKRDESEESEEEEEERRRERSPEDGMLSDELDSDLIRDRERRLYGRDQEGEDEEDEAPLEDIRRMQVRRSRLEEWLNEPFFEDTLPGCLIRVPQPPQPGVPLPIGMDGQPIKQYILCQVIAVEARPAGIFKDSGAPVQNPYRVRPGGPKTHKWLLVERGASQRCMPITVVSNQPMDEREFESLQRALREAHRPQLSRRTARDVHERLVKAADYTYTAEDVDRLLKEKRAKGAAPRNAALEKARLENELSHAREQGDSERVAELEAAQAALEAARASQPGGASRRTKFDMASLNKRNADMNFKNALDNVSNRPGAAAGAAAGAGGESSRLDPFSRRATRPQIYWSTKRQAEGEGEEPSQDPAAEAAAAAAAEDADGVGDADGGAAAKGRGKGGRLDLDAIVDLSELDLAALERPARMPPLARKLLGPTWRPGPPPPGLPVVSLDEYKRSKGWA